MKELKPVKAEIDTYIRGELYNRCHLRIEGGLWNTIYHDTCNDFWYSIDSQIIDSIIDSIHE